MFKKIITLVTANLASKPLGLARQIVFATLYGVTAVMSACRFAQTMTLVFMNFFTTDTLNAGFLPLFERYKKKSDTLAYCFFWYLFLLLLILSSLIFSILFWGAGFIVHWFAPGFQGAVADTTIQFMKVFSLATPFCLLGTLFAYLAMSSGSCFAIGARPMFESVGLILGTLSSVYRHHVLDIAWSFVITYLLFFSLVVLICLQKKLIRFVSLKSLLQPIALLGSDFWATIKPLLILPLFMQGKFVIEKCIASLMAVSIVAALDYARFILETGINVLATPIGLLSLSFFSLLEGEKLSQKIESLVLFLLALGIPLTLFLTLNSELIISLLYGYGAFDKKAIQEASTILTGMSLAFFAQLIGYVLLKILSARLQNKRVMLYMISALTANILFIVFSFRALGPISLGIGESIYAFMIFILCVRYFKLTAYTLKIASILAPTSLLYVIGTFYLEKTILFQLNWFILCWGATGFLFQLKFKKQLAFNINNLKA